MLAQPSAQNAVGGAGLLDAGSQNLQVRVAGAFLSIDDIKRFPIRAASATTGTASTLQLSDIAGVRRGTIDPPAFTVRRQGQAVIALGVSMAKGGDIVALGHALRDQVNTVQADLPAGITL